MAFVTDEQTLETYRWRLRNMLSDAKGHLQMPNAMDAPAFPGDATAMAKLLWTIDGSGTGEPVGWIYLHDGMVHDAAHLPELAKERREAAPHETEVPIRAEGLLVALGFELGGLDLRDAASDMQSPFGPQNLGDRKFGPYKFIYKGIVEQVSWPTRREMSVTIRADGWSTLVAMQDGAQVGDTAFVTATFAGVGHVPTFRLAGEDDIARWVEPEHVPVSAGP